MSEPKDPKGLGDQAHMGSPVPPTNPSASSSTATDASSSIPGGTSNPSLVVKDATSDPLFGAPSPSSSTPEKDQGQASRDALRERIEAGSEDRVRSLKAARKAALHQTRETPTQPPPISHLSSAPRQSSTLIPYLRRLSTILSILLGSGAVISLVWSALLLPLLHASFSARRALVDQQVNRVKGLLQGLKEIRARGMFGAFTEQEGEVGSEGAIRDGDENAVALRTENKHDSKAMIRELSSSAHSSTSSSSESASTVPLLPDLSPLLVSLRNLASTRSNTSTTRTSLLSTIESYTSALHRQLWNPRPGRAGWGTGYGLGTLDESLRAEGGKIGGGVYKDGWEGEGLGDRREEWDSVRKEIRGLKGLLLGRRSMGVGA